MKSVRKSILWVLSIMLFSHLTSEGCEEKISDDFWATTTPAAMKQIAVLNPGSNLDAVLVAISGGPAASFALIRRDLLPQALPSSGIVTTDLQSVLNDLRPASGSLGQATTDLINLVNYPGIPLGPLSSGVLITDLTSVLNTFYFGATDFGSAITTLFNTIDFPSSPSNAPNFNLLYYHLASVKNTIDGAATLGLAATAAFSKVNVPALSALGPLIVSSNVLTTDIDTVKGKINPASADLGTSVANTLNRLNNFILNYDATGPYGSIDAALTHLGY